ncbi:MAG: phosphotransferase, partial [Sphingobacteriia bacterium]|nr:phosphotransferase [Sphingobacteriia bacterium]
FGPNILKVAYNHWLKLNKEVNKTSYKNSMLHNDPNLRNVLWNGKKIFLLDWELAGLEDPRKELAHICAWYGLNEKLTDVFLSSYLKRKPSSQELLTNEGIKKIILLEFAWVGLSSLKNNISINEWDRLYSEAEPKKVEDLSLIQMSSENKPSVETLRMIYLGLIKQFINEVTKDK